MSDKMIVKGCQQNDRLAQKALFDKYQRTMYTIAYRMLNDYELANDVLQKTFITVFNKINQLNDANSVKSWIRTTLIRNVYKASNKKIIYEKINEINETQTYYKWEDPFTAEHLEKAILSLPDAARQIFVLFEIEGYKHIEIAKALNISEGTSKSQLNYAKKLLQHKLWDIYKS